MRLRALLDTDALGLRLLGGEDELDRTVRGVMTTDLRDPSRYLSGGELVLTGLAWRRDAGGLRAVRTDPGAAPGSPGSRRARRSWATSRRTWSRPAPGTGCRCSRWTRRSPSPTITEHVVRQVSGERAGDLAAVVDRHRRLMTSGPGGRRPRRGPRPARLRPGPARLGALPHRPRAIGGRRPSPLPAAACAPSWPASSWPPARTGRRGPAPGGASSGATYSLFPVRGAGAARRRRRATCASRAVRLAPGRRGGRRATGRPSGWTCCRASPS